MTFSRSENDVHISDASLLQELLKIPRKILNHRDVADLAQLVLHAIGHDARLGLGRAAYLVNNPDFNYLKGIAGYSPEDCKLHGPDLWSNPSLSSQNMQKASFHNKIKAVEGPGFHKNMSPVHHAQLLSQELGMKNSDVHVWDTHHGNHGILIFEEGAQSGSVIKRFLEQIAALLELCPAQNKK